MKHLRLVRSVWLWFALILLLPAVGEGVHLVREHRASLASVPQGDLPYLKPDQPISARVADLLRRMTLEEKVGQMMQVSSGQIRDYPALVKSYGLGSVMSGGDDKPSSNNPGAWRRMVDGFQSQALRTRLHIPLIYGFDAVHGANDVKGATIFPHNIGLGATRDPKLVELIGRAVAEESAGTGVRWTFAPAVSVARNIRWGRTYESFGEEPQLVSQMGAALVRGFQGRSLSAEPTSVLASAKAFIGDGDTRDGLDRGDTQATVAELRRVDLLPYVSAVKRAVGSVMASFSSVNGIPNHANGELLTGVLKHELGFRGFVVSDWDAINGADGDFNAVTLEDVKRAVDAGVDMIMIGGDDPARIRDFLRQGVEAGVIPMSRVDDAVSRILRVKLEMGLFEHPYSDPKLGASIGSRAHRALARRAVRESLVLLKNQGGILPLAKRGSILVAGKSADDVGLQSGGWTISWQGASGATTPGTTILQAIRRAAPAAKVDYSRDGSAVAGHSVAIVALGEQPYAEWHGDRPQPDGLGLDPADRSTLARVAKSGVPTVVVLVSGRPLVITGQLGSMRALVAAWLPGSEGEGVADVLFGDARPIGKLPQSWPASAAQIGVHPGDKGYHPLFPFGFGLTYPVR
ncbi:MAG: glycoside hydrolase family 3 protein [Gaiellaceae bacterium]